MDDSSDPIARRAPVFRIGLGLLALSLAGPGVWALLAPRSFYDDFPGFGRHWVSPLGPYDEHLVTDVGSTFLALVALMALAALWLGTRLVRAALIAWLVYAIPHTLFHLANLGAYEPADQVVNAVALILQVAVAALLLGLTFAGAGREPGGRSA